MLQSKTKIRFTLIAAFLLLFVGFFIFKYPINPRLEAKHSESYETEFNTVKSAYLKEMAKTAKLHVNGSGGCLSEKITLVAFSFRSNAKCDVDTSRQLLVYSVNTLLEKINENEKLRPFLSQYPFTHENVEISISFFDKKNTYYPQEYVSIVLNTKNKINFGVFDPEIYNYKTLKEEPF
jgi:hypothetical protein